MGGCLPKSPNGDGKDASGAEIPQIDGQRDFWIGLLVNDPICADPSLYGRLTAREFYEWYVQVNRARKERVDQALAGAGAGGGGETSGDLLGMKPGDTVMEAPMTEEGALFFLKALGVEGVPTPAEAKAAREAKDGNPSGGSDLPGD